jgi:hypothetical protein
MKGFRPGSYGVDVTPTGGGGGGYDKQATDELIAKKNNEILSLKQEIAEL